MKVTIGGETAKIVRHAARPVLATTTGREIANRVQPAGAFELAFTTGPATVKSVRPVAVSDFTNGSIASAFTAAQKEIRITIGRGVSACLVASIVTKTTVGLVANVQTAGKKRVARSRESIPGHEPGSHQLSSVNIAVSSTFLDTMPFA
jgi:hypothetical protein